jgi:hypothetical protein
MRGKPRQKRFLKITYIFDYAPGENIISVREERRKWVSDHSTGPHLFG